MARHFPYPRSIRHSCGHRKDHVVYGRYAEEARIQEFRLAHQDCIDCVKARMLLEKELSLPPLSGTDKTVPWATYLRIRLASALKKYGAQDAVESLKSITDAKWFIDNREAKLRTIIDMLTT